MEVKNASYTCLACKRTYEQQGAPFLAWPTNMSELAREEAEYHDYFDEQAVEVHQLERPRNLIYHTRIWDMLKKVPKGGRLLEIGAGSGFDAQKLAQEYELVLTDISPKTLDRLAHALKSSNTTYVACDGEKLPFENESFAGVYMIATWHHLEHPDAGLKEAHRVLKPGGMVVMGIEPNAFYFKPIKHLRKLLCGATHTHADGGSHADAEMEGFTYKQMDVMLKSGDWTDVSIQPMWIVAGWMHYGLEFAYRAFKLKKRIVVPAGIERSLVAFDEFLFTLPLMKHVGWHWIISAKKKK